METWAWLVAYVIGFALLQVYLYLYFIKGRSTGTESSAETSPPSAPERSGAAVEAPDGIGDTDAVSCSNCGAYNENDPMFTFCQHCGDRLQ
jgi:hypothetical protein